MVIIMVILFLFLLTQGIMLANICWHEVKWIYEMPPEVILFEAFKRGIITQPEYQELMHTLLKTQKEVNENESGNSRR